MVTIQKLSAHQANSYLGGLIHLLQDAVEDGASLGFLPPLEYNVAENYWRGVFAEAAQSKRLLFIALSSDLVVGSIQLELATKQNAGHRAEVQKVIVHREFRRQGIGAGLMGAAENAARAVERTLLVLDTRSGDPSERLYTRMGYVRAGTIPQYARSSTGTLDGTTFYYRLLS